MGGGDYDRDVGTTYSGGGGTSGAVFTTGAEEAMRENRLNEELDPRGKRIVCNGGTPIVVAIDVTGSMGDWSKIMYDKLPMFYGQLIMQAYCPTPQISFAGIGDAPAFDQGPVQIGNFTAKTALDGVISKMWLEGLGGGNRRESYDLTAYYYASDCVQLSGLAPNTKPFFFITGDEGLYDEVDADGVRKWINESADGLEGIEFPTQRVKATLPSDLEATVRRVQLGLSDGTLLFADLPEGASPGSMVELCARVSGKGSWNLKSLFSALCQKYHVYHLHKAFSSGKAEEVILQQWGSLIGPERVLTLEEPKAIVDVILGVIAITTGSRETLDEYIQDMKDRGQSEERIEHVEELLANIRRYDASELPAEVVQEAISVRPAEGINAVNEELQSKLNYFVKNGAPKSVFECPCGLTDQQKRNLHGWASKHGLKSASVGEGAGRYLTMTQPPAPMRFVCPIHFDRNKGAAPDVQYKVMEDPVIDATGHTYDRANIEEHLATTGRTSYLTKASLPHTTLTPNAKLVEDIKIWKALHGIS